MKITDMNLICLEECFEYLELGDLLSVADANKRLRKAAQCVYDQKYSKMKVDFLVKKESRYADHKILDDGMILIVYSVKFALQFLRCFGHLIKYSGYVSLDDSIDLVLTYLNEYCAESLVTFEFYKVLDDQLRLLTNTFTKVQRVEINDCYLVEGGWFKRTFPNVQYVKFSNLQKISLPNITCLVDHFPHLKRLMYECYVEHSLDPIKDHMAGVLRLNPQLKRLHLGGSVCRFPRDDPAHAWDSKPLFDFDTFRSVIEPMQNLEDLKLDGCFASFFNCNGNKIHSKSIKRFTHYSIEPNYPFAFDHLEFFRMDDHVTEDVYDFIEQHPTIKALGFKANSLSAEFSSIINVSRLVNIIPSLLEIEIDYKKLMSVDDLVRLVSSFKSLKKLAIRTEKSTKKWRKKLRERLGDKWQIPVEYAKELRERLWNFCKISVKRGDEWEISSRCNWWTRLERYDHSANE